MFKYRHQIKLFLTVIVAGLGFFITPLGFSCSLVLKNDSHPAVMVGRNMDWLEDTEVNLYVYPQGMLRKGLASGNSLNWQSRYGSIVAVAYDTLDPVSTDGINERGLSAHILSLAESDFGERDEKLPGLSILLWVQYYLDNFQTVDEAVRFTQSNSFQVIPYYFPKVQRLIKLHLALEDASGDSAIIEYIDGKANIYHDKSYRVLTNSPTYDKQLANLKLYKGFGGDKPLPGSTTPIDRFVRAAYYSSYLGDTESVQEEMHGVLSVMANVSQPYGTPTAERPIISPTLWRTVSDLTHKTYYFNSTSRFNIIWASLDKFNLNPGNSVKKLDLVHLNNLAGDVSADFTPV